MNPVMLNSDQREMLRAMIKQRLIQNNKMSLADVGALYTALKASMATKDSGLQQRLLAAVK